jgi:3-deoxy-manno-octulosonate cytidylyltransferase (CMP-KDO synthetase)
MKRIILIPARLESSRLPKKVLLDLGGKPMIQRVYEQCIQVKGVNVFIATNSEEIKTTCSHFTKNILLTHKNHNSGTDRIAEAIKQIGPYDCVINVQADEPFIEPILISSLFDELENQEVQMVSAMKKIHSVKDLHNPNVVKVVTDMQNNALYFSRGCIPALRDEENKNITNEELKHSSQSYFKHLGIYGFKRTFLAEFAATKMGRLEKLERLEQLRALEIGVKIKMVETNYTAFGIDTYNDYLDALTIYKQQ